MDDAVAHSGSRSLRLEFRPPFSGATQFLDATAYRGEKIVFRAMLRSRDLGSGTSGVWIRADTAAGDVAAFEHSYLQTLEGTRDWTPREVKMTVPTPTGP